MGKPTRVVSPSRKEFIVTDEEFAALTTRYVAATEARLALIKAGRPATDSALATYRELAEQEWELGLAWDAELLRPSDG
jgi:hypothetical protein